MFGNWNLARSSVLVMLLSLLHCGCNEDAPEAPAPATSDVVVDPPAAEEKKPPADVPPAEVPETPNSPDQTLREFLIAMATGDQDVLAEVCVPNADLDILSGGQKPTPGQLTQMKQMFASIDPRRLEVGDTINWMGQEKQVDASMVGEDRLLLTFPGNPIPFQVVKQDGEWKVDASSIIAARKAAMQQG